MSVSRRLIAEEYAHEDVEHKHAQSYDQGTGPGEVLPVFVGTHGKLEDHDRRFAMGWFMSSDQNWLLSAVNSSGAVSPPMRATASRIPVMIPAFAARTVTRVITFHCGAPSAAAASRRLSGTRRSMFSVVRITTGITISASAIVPAQAEK